MVTCIDPGTIIELLVCVLFLYGFLSYGSLPVFLCVWLFVTRLSAFWLKIWPFW